MAGKFTAHEYGLVLENLKKEEEKNVKLRYDLSKLNDNVDLLRAEKERAVSELNQARLDIAMSAQRCSRLEAALKPILDYKSEHTWNMDDFMAACHCMNLISESQRIYNGGEHDS